MPSLRPFAACLLCFSLTALADGTKPLSGPTGPTAPTGEKTGVFEWFLETWDDVRTRPSSPDEVARHQLAKCAHCHDAGNTWNVPPIPFTDDTKLLAWLDSRHVYREKELTGRELFLQLVWREQHMPKRLMPYHERKALKEFIENFKGPSTGTRPAP